MRDAATEHLVVGEEEEPEDAIARILSSAASPRSHVDTAPLVDIAHDPNVELRRGAIALLAKQADQTAVRLIRDLLKDAHQDVRSDASVALSHLETSSGRAIKDAHPSQDESNPTAGKSYAELCYQYATSDILDDVSSKLYLSEARTALSEYVARKPTCAEAWVLMARIHVARGEMSEALQAADRALAVDNTSPEALLLAAEIAFQQRDWHRLRALARQVSVSFSGDRDEDWAVLQWWAEA